MHVQGFSSVTYPRPVVSMKAVQAGGAVPTQVQQAPVLDAQGAANLYLMNRLIGNEQDQRKLRMWGSGNPFMLRFSTGGPIRRSITSFLTGIPADRLVVYGQMADMMRIRGMSPDAAHLLVRSGVRSPGDLSRYSGSGFGQDIQRGVLFAALTAKAFEIAANEGRSYTPPSMQDLATLSQSAIGLGSSISY